MKSPFILPDKAVEILSGGVAIFLGLGVKTIFTPNLALKVANTQLVTSSSADKLERLANELKEQAKLIEQKDLAYEELEATYKAYTNRQTGNVQLEKAIEKASALPKPDRLDEIEIEISETEEDLLSILSPFSVPAFWLV